MDKRWQTCFKPTITWKRLDLSLNNLGGPAFKALAEALGITRTLWSLSLHGNVDLVNESIGPRSGFDALVEVLKEQNHVIQETVLASADDPRVALYLTTNRTRHLLEGDGVTEEELVGCLSGNKGHLSFLYI